MDVMFARLRFTAVAILALYMLPVAGGLLQPAVQNISPRVERLKRFLQGYERNPVSHAKRTTRYAAAFVHLDDDGKEEAIIYLIGPRWCGSGGCSLLILKPNGSSFKVIT